MPRKHAAKPRRARGLAAQRGTTAIAARLLGRGELLSVRVPVREAGRYGEQDRQQLSPSTARGGTANGRGAHGTGQFLTGGCFARFRLFFRLAGRRRRPASEWRNRRVHGHRRNQQPSDGRHPQWRGMHHRKACRTIGAERTEHQGEAERGERPIRASSTLDFKVESGRSQEWDAHGAARGASRPLWGTPSILRREESLESTLLGRPERGNPLRKTLTPAQ